MFCWVASLLAFTAGPFLLASINSVDRFSKTIRITNDSTEISHMACRQSEIDENSPGCRYADDLEFHAKLIKNVPGSASNFSSYMLRIINQLDDAKVELQRICDRTHDAVPMGYGAATEPNCDGNGERWLRGHSVWPRYGNVYG